MGCSPSRQLRIQCCTGCGLPSRDLGQVDHLLHLSVVVDVEEVERAAVLDLLAIAARLAASDVVDESTHVRGLALGRRGLRRRHLLDDHGAPPLAAREAVDGRVQSVEGGSRLLAVGAAAVDVNLLEEAAEPPQLADRRRVGSRDHRPAEGAQADQLRDRDPGIVGDRAELRLLGGRHADVEALGERRPAPLLRNGTPLPPLCGLREAKAPSSPGRRSPRLREAKRRAGGA